MPKTSVLLAVYNGESKIERAIQSILSQDFRDFELVVIDDGSTDKTVQIVSEIQKKDKRIILHSIPHSGLAKALNAGFRISKGEYIARMDVDDVSFRDRFRKQVAYLDDHPRVGVVGTAYEVELPNGERLIPKVPLLTTDYEIKKALPQFNPFFHGSTMMRKSLLDQIGGYDERFLLAQDYDLWFRLSKLTQFANLSEVLMVRHEDLKTTLKESRQNWFGIRARWHAILDGNTSVLNIGHIIRPFFVMVTPIWFRNFIRKYF